jgi:hypothetical protein
MKNRIDQRSFMLGKMFAYSELIGIGLKEMAFSSPFLPQEYHALVHDAQRIARDHGVRLRLEKKILVTDLFPEEFTRGKWVFIIYKDPRVLERYMGLKSWKAKLLKVAAYKGRERKSIAEGLGKLLSYRNQTVRELLRNNSDRN